MMVLVAYARVIGERVLPLVTALLSAAGDPDLRRFADTIDAEHATGTRRIAGYLAERFDLRPGLDAAGATDILWAITGYDVAHRLVNRRAWGWDRYEAWLAGTAADLLLGPAT